MTNKSKLEVKLSKRIANIDYVRAIAIILVVAGHVNFANYHIKALIYSFHMPLFFFVSGLVMKENDRNQNIWNVIVDTVKKYIPTLVVPYILWAFIYSGFSWKKFLLIIYGSYATITKSGSLSSLWFLNTLFISIIISNLMIYIINSKSILLIISMIIGIIGYSLPNLNIGYPFCIDIAMVAIVFIILGYVCRNLFRRFSVKSNIQMIQVVLLIIMATIIGVVAILKNDIEIGYVLMANRNCGNYMLFLISALTGIFVVSILTIFFGEKIKGKYATIFSYIGQNTFVIFAVHKPLIILFEKVFNKIDCYSIIALIITTVFVIAISCLISKLMNKYTKILCGK